ncbi:transcriptional regulator, partial [Cereibacter changlensis]
RARVEAALALRLGGGTKGREAASLMFSAWQGQMLWQDAGGRGFKLKEAAKRVQRAT